MRILPMIAMVSVLAPCAATAAPPVTLPPEVAAHVPADLRSYFLALKITPAAQKEMSTEVFERHQAYIRQQIEKKVYQLVGPVTDGGRIRGLTILTAVSAEEAKRIVSADPAVQAGVLDVEVHPAVFPNLDSLAIHYAPRK